MNRNKSIIQKDMSECFICGATKGLHTHEIFYGINRQKSIRYGAYIRLCARHHNMSNAGIHFNHKLDNDLKKLAQRELEKTYSREWFIKTFGKSYLKEEKNDKNRND